MGDPHSLNKKTIQNQNTVNFRLQWRQKHLKKNYCWNDNPQIQLSRSSLFCFFVVFKEFLKNVFFQAFAQQHQCGLSMSKCGNRAWVVLHCSPICVGQCPSLARISAVGFVAPPPVSTARGRTCWRDKGKYVF